NPVSERISQSLQRSALPGSSSWNGAVAMWTSPGSTEDVAEGSMRTGGTGGVLANAAGEVRRQHAVSTPTMEKGAVGPRMMPWCDLHDVQDARPRPAVVWSAARHGKLEN